MEEPGPPLIGRKHLSVEAQVGRIQHIYYRCWGEISFLHLLIVSFAGKRASNDECDWDVGVGPGERGHVEYLPEAYR